MKFPTIYCPDESSMQQLANLLMRSMPARALVFLDADLGMGKTFFAQACIKYYGYSGKIKSPTYTLVEEYQCQSGKILHFDLYRLADSEELEFIGIWDYLEQTAISFIEWPEKGHGVLPVPDLIISIDDGQPSGRIVMLEAIDTSIVAAIDGIFDHLVSHSLTCKVLNND